MPSGRSTSSSSSVCSAVVRGTPVWTGRVGPRRISASCRGSRITRFPALQHWQWSRTNSLMPPRFPQDKPDSVVPLPGNSSQARTRRSEVNLTRTRAIRLLQASAAVAALAVGMTGALVPAQAAGALSWVQATPTQAPPGRAYAAMTYDSLRGRTVLFGGSSNASSNFGDTWEWDGINWTQRIPSTSPPGLVGAAMVYDTARSRSVLFGGGLTAGLAPAATWEWDGSTWTLRAPASSPPERIWPAMAYDSFHRVPVLFGGSAQGVDLGDTWVFAGTTWTHLTPANSPSPRFGHAMACDSVRNRVVLFGGRSNGVRMADTWEWDGSNWTQISTSSAPSARFWHSMAFDSGLGRTRLFGGDHVAPFSLGPVNDTWEWDGANWTQDVPSAAPSPRAGQSMAYDSGRARTIVFGGTDEGFPGVFYNDIWELVPPVDNDLGLAGTPGNFTVNATSSSGVSVTYTSPTAVDEAGDSPVATVACTPASGSTFAIDESGDSPPATVSCAPVSGSTFAIGTTTVTCTASDADDTPNTVSQGFTVTVLDTDLAITGVPADVTAIATGTSGAVVTYAAPTAVDEAGDSAAATASCSPVWGSTFPVGATTVTCTAGSPDDSPATVSATFTVTVLVDLNVAVSVAPTSAITGTKVVGTMSLTNDSAASRTVTLVDTFSFVSATGQTITLTSSSMTIHLDPGQTVNRLVTFKVTRDLPRGTYAFSATASDVTGSTSDSATFNVT